MHSSAILLPFSLSFARAREPTKPIALKMYRLLPISLLLQPLKIIKYCRAHYRNYYRKSGADGSARRARVTFLHTVTAIVATREDKSDGNIGNVPIARRRAFRPESFSGTLLRRDKTAPRTAAQRARHVALHKYYYLAFRELAYFD